MNIKPNLLRLHLLVKTRSLNKYSNFPLLISTAFLNTMAQESALNDNDEKKQITSESTFKVNVPKSQSKYSSKQELINIAKCQLYQWMEVQTIPSPHRSRMYTETIQRQYPSLQFNDETYSNWLTEIAAIYRLKYEPTDETTENNNDDTENKTDVTDKPDPEWLSLQIGNIDNLLLDKYKINKLSLQDRCLGCILGVFIVDALGAPVEGWPYESIIEKCNPRGVINMIPGTHMGARDKGPRCGYYTDDTMTTMALALSIVENQKLLAQHAAENYYKFWATNPVYRGLPDSAQKVLTDVISGMSITITGRQSFADGSYANGGAMRISPVGLSYRNATNKVLKDAVIDAVMSSHCHPQSIDGAMCIALMVQYALKCDGVNKKFDYKELVDILLDNIDTKEMKNIIEIVGKGYEEFLKQPSKDDDDCMDDILNYDLGFLKDNHLLTFQIKAIEAVPMVLYCLLRWYKNPEQCAINVVTLGGDCDTTGNMVGAVLGALYGTSWIPKRWYENLENTWREKDDEKAEYKICTNAYGLDLAEYLGLELSKLDFTEHEKFVETKNVQDTKNDILSKIKSLFPKKQSV